MKKIDCLTTFDNLYTVSTFTRQSQTKNGDTEEQRVFDFNRRLGPRTCLTWQRHRAGSNAMHGRVSR
jgi:hypothetical protein